MPSKLSLVHSSTSAHTLKIIACFTPPPKKNSRRGRKSDGVAVLVRKSLMQFVTCVECDYDNMICFKLCKDRLGLDRDLLFVSLYVPPYQSPYYKQCDTNCSIHHLEDFLLSLCENGDTSYIMVAGDLNARIGDWSLSADVTSNDVLRCDVDEEGNRQSQDKITNQFGKILIDFCTTFHCTPLNGNHTGDENGQFTFVSNQGNSVIDYFIVSVDLISKLNMNFVVGDRVESSHMPLQLNINSHPNTKGKMPRNEKKKESTTTLKWNREEIEDFLEAIHSEESQSGMQKAFQFLDSCIDSAQKKFTETLLQAAERRGVRFGSTRATGAIRTGGTTAIASERSVKHAAHRIVFRKPDLMWIRQRIEKKDVSTNRQYRKRKSSTKLQSTRHF